MSLGKVLVHCRSEPNSSGICFDEGSNIPKKIALCFRHIRNYLCPRGKGAIMENVAEKRRIPRLRTIKAAWEEVRKLDPETAVTEWYIRQLCKTNQIIYFCRDASR